jgi:hypothetical protein
MQDDPTQHDEQHGNPATLVSATLYLMSAYRLNPCPRLATMVTRHLALIAAHPAVDRLVRRTSLELIGTHWVPAEQQACGVAQGAPGAVRPLLH